MFRRALFLQGVGNALSLLFLSYPFSRACAGWQLKAGLGMLLIWRREIPLFRIVPELMPAAEPRRGAVRRPRGS